MSNTTMMDVLNDLLIKGRLRPEELEGCSPKEIDEVRLAQRLVALPDDYRQFLSVAGRGAGRLLVGSDVFYPRLLKIKGYAEELLQEEDIGLELGPDSLVLQVHQGYQAFWVPSVADPGLPVVMFQEGDPGISTRWSNVGAYLASMATTLLE